MKPRISRGLPRGGIGYLGLPIGLASSLAAWRLGGLPSLVISCLACPFCLWLGVGLRADGLDGEVVDHVTWESPRRYDWFRVQDNLVWIFRLSTCVLLFGMAVPILALWRWIETR